MKKLAVGKRQLAKDLATSVSRDTWLAFGKAPIWGLS